MPGQSDDTLKQLTERSPADWVVRGGWPAAPANVSPQQWLSGGLGLVPLAPLGNAGLEQLPAVIAKVKKRLDRDATPRDAAELWAATLILMGLRYEQAVVEKLMQGVLTMEESVTYQAILKKGEARGEARGKAEEAMRMLMLLGRRKLGEPSPEAMAALDGVTDIHRLEELALQLEHATSWPRLLGLAAPQGRSRKRKPLS
jgi:predicted transposase YdaD